MIETVAVLLPTKGRAAQFKRNVETLLNADMPNGYELVVIVAYIEGDNETIEALQDLVRDTRVLPVKRSTDSTAVQGWNMAYSYLGYIDWFVLGADDIVWDKDWLKVSSYIMQTTPAKVIGLNDLHTNLDDYAPHYMVHRDYLNQYQCGEFIPPEYKTWWFDREMCQRARMLGLYAPAWQAIAEHKHPDWGTASVDSTYQDATGFRDHDRAVYLRRMKEYASTSTN